MGHAGAAGRGGVSGNNIVLHEEVVFFWQQEIAAQLAVSDLGFAVVHQRNIFFLWLAGKLVSKRAKRDPRGIAVFHMPV